MKKISVSKNTTLYLQEVKFKMYLSWFPFSNLRVHHHPLNCEPGMGVFLSADSLQKQTRAFNLTIKILIVAEQDTEIRLSGHKSACA